MFTSRLPKRLLFAPALAILIFSCGQPDKHRADIAGGTVGKLQAELDSIKKFNGSRFRGSADLLRLEMTRLDGWALIANEAESDANKELKPIAVEMKKELSKLQAREYPAMRRDFVEISKEKMGLNSITLAISGQDYTILEMSGRPFVDIRQAEKTRETMSGFLDKFRIKQLDFRAREGGKVVKHYDLKTAPDTKLTDVRL